MASSLITVNHDKLATSDSSSPAEPYGPDKGACQFTFDAIGTRWQIDSEESLSSDLRDHILDRIRRFDTTYSRFRPDSLVSQISIAPDGGRFRFPEDSLALFDLYDHLHAATQGAVDPLVGRQLELLGYDAMYSLVPAPDAVWAEERARGRATWAADVVRDGTTLVTRRPLVIDAGAAGKGYLVDIVSAILQEAGIARFVVDAGGDLLHTGRHGIRVGLEHPFDARRVIGVARLEGRALCASGTTRRAWGDGLHHVLDARTGLPTRESACAAHPGCAARNWPRSPGSASSTTRAWSRAGKYTRAPLSLTPSHVPSTWVNTRTNICASSLCAPRSPTLSGPLEQTAPPPHPRSRPRRAGPYNPA